MVSPELSGVPGTLPGTPHRASPATHLVGPDGRSLPDGLRGILVLHEALVRHTPLVRVFGPAMPSRSLAWESR